MLTAKQQNPFDGAVCYVNAKGQSSRRDEPFQSGQNASRTLQDQDQSTTKELMPRQSPMEGFGYPPNEPVPIGAIVGKEVAEMFNSNGKRPRKISRSEKECVTCDDGQERKGCCGCVSMDDKWGYSDIPTGDLEYNRDDGTWPFSDTLSRRAIDAGLADLQEEDYDDDDDSANELLERAVRTKATRSHKTVKVCGLKSQAGPNYRYPAFPADSSVDWDTLDSGNWKPVPRYWGNQSSSCSDWSTAKLNPADDEYTQAGQLVRAKYQSTFAHS